MRDRVVAFEENFCVRAGAGAGKTGCLVDTYLGLLEGREGRAGLTPSQVVAITFTNKAADEMRGRIQLKLAQRAGEVGAGKHWAESLAAVEWAPIVTIHSFCVSLLREFGVLLELDPEFAVLEARDYGDLLQVVIGDLLRRGLAEGDPGLGRLLGTYSLAGLSQELEKLSQGLSTQGMGAAQARVNTAQAFAAQMERGPGLVRDMGEVMGGLRDALAEGEVNLKTKYGPKVLQALEMWPQARERLAGSEADAGVIEELAGVFSGGWGKVNALRQCAVSALGDLAGLVNCPACASLSDDLLSLTERLEKELALELSRRAALSFDHLLLLGLRLLRDHPPVLAELRRRFRALLVDEFQDVNPVQGHLVFLLAGLENAAGELRDPGQEAADLPRLLLVGDPKQSIYAFRGADKKVFDGAQARLETLALGNNYRSNGELVSFFNHIFSKIFQVPEKGLLTGEEFHIFSPDDLQAFPNHGPDSQADAPGQQPVEVLECAGLEPDASLDEWRILEAQAMAWRIRELLDQGIAPGQVAVLFRAMSRIPVYEQALEQAGVPFYTVGGRGYYQVREVADLALGLRATFFPGDGLALAGALRSSLGGLDDASLLALTHPEGQEPGRSLSRSLGHPLPDWIAPQQRQLWSQWQDLLAWLRQWGRRLTPAELLTGLMEARDLPPLHLCTPGGRQRLANLRKLVETARAASSLPPGGASGFAQQLWDLVNDPPDEPIAPLLAEGADVVRLMSVHQAKGLEFPVVVLADLASRPPANGGLALGQGGVLAAKPWDPEKGERLSSTLSQLLGAQARDVVAAEAARLFYVACTRAEKRLIFCANGSKRQWLWGKWLVDVVTTAPQVKQVPVCTSPLLSGPETTHALARAPYLPGQPGPLDAEGAALVARVLDSTPLPLTKVTESVSGLENWLTCPRLYLLTRRLGLDTALLVQGQRGGAAPGPGAVNLGSLVHQALELADLTAGPQSLTPALDLALTQMGLAPEDGDLAAQVAAGWWNTDLPALLAPVAPHDLHREKTFHLLLPGQNHGPDLELLGEFDLLARLPDDRWLLVDYKVTDKIAPREYEAQLALYALALWQGQGRAGNPPRTLLCYLGRQAAQLHELTFTPQDLERWRVRAMAAALGIASLAPHAQPHDLTPSPHCSPSHCHLHGSGLC